MPELPEEAEGPSDEEADESADARGLHDDPDICEQPACGIEPPNAANDE
jgi:hypothetical protein